MCMVGPATIIGSRDEPPNKRLQLALRASHKEPLYRSDCGFRGRYDHELIAFVHSCVARSSRRS
jgi:hypothetical protein